MKIHGKHYRSVWPEGKAAFGIIDQTKLPHEFVTLTLRSADDAAHAIKSMQTRGAPLIGAVGAYGLALAVREDASDENIQKVVEMLAETRPTAINLRWALGRMRDALQQESFDREHAERQNEQDQERQAPGVDPEQQAAEAVVAIGFDVNVCAEEFAD